MAKKQFKAESKRLLDLMINSIYTHKEIFLRELISNASDAIDKLYYKSLADGATGLNRDDFQIFLAADKDSRTLRIRDNGIGIGEPHEPTGHYGLNIMRERAERLSGTLTFSQPSGGGTLVSISFRSAESDSYLT